ncbi:MAG: hypothetical protein HOP12_03175 [Candidatus Eisenbacteria bacterium]|uniref:Uncharacterized protein n=1 Tax=Eiseniibacteriota bacterium TaxID=2212470 RepID=A0A849SF94_UNCEI|nr:hypothetical protein [Candidatus Eisenbacteria bacterium]
MIRRQKLFVLVGLALTLLLNTGCLRAIKLFSVNLDNLSAVNGNPAAGFFVDLAEESSEYADNQDKIKAVEEYTLLGDVRNNLATPVEAEVWIVQDPGSPTLLVDKADVVTAGGVKLMTLTLAANETKSIEWSRNPLGWLFASFGGSTDPVVNELEGDGLFELYVFGSTGTYNVDVLSASFVVTVDVGP